MEDVWRLPGVGGRDDFRRLIELIASQDPGSGSSRAARLLWALRWKLGSLLGWDRPEGGIGARVASVRERMPADMRAASRGPDFASLPFEPLYLLEDEWAAELANRTVHGVMHIGLIPDGGGSFHAQMAVLVKPNGLLGETYLAAIRPFRYLLVYPRLMRDLERVWLARANGRRETNADGG